MSVTPEVYEAQQAEVMAIVGPQALAELQMKGYCVRKKLDIHNVIAEIGLNVYDWRQALRELWITK